MKATKIILLTVAACLLIGCGATYYFFFSPMSVDDQTTYLYIDDDDDIDSVMTKLKPTVTAHSRSALGLLANVTSYAENIRTGRYAISPNEGALTTFRRLKNGLQTPVNLTIPPVRTIERLSAGLSNKLMLDSATICNALKDEKTCRELGFDTTTVICMFIPNTYDIYWNTSAENLLKRMKREYDRFWDEERMERAGHIGMNPTQVMTLASIIDEETANDEEKPMIAGMYYNRLQLRNSEYPSGMPLQADPTIKFAWKRFDLRRIYHKLLNIDSPYNTYRRPGLPPGPIRIPSVAGIEAVLNMARHDYLYMCAKEDFSGTHNFARTYDEHMANARRYTQALNARGIK